MSERMITKFAKNIPIMARLINKLDFLENENIELKKRCDDLEEKINNLSQKDVGLDYRIDDVYHKIFLCSKEMEQLYGTIMTKEQLKDSLKRWYRKETGRILDLEYDQGFDEKIQKLKLVYGNEQYKNFDLVCELCDKLAARGWIKKLIGEEFLVPLLGKWERFEEIDFNELPEKFVLKCNHGSGMNYVIKDKSNIDIYRMRDMFTYWLNINYAYYTGFEMQYKNVHPAIIAEKYIEELDGNLFDYKVHCFNGEPLYIQIIGDRDLATHEAKQLVYDFNWNKQKWTFGDYPRYEKELERPSNLGKLYQLCKKLCEDFEYVRVDFYIIESQILFGEMTFTPGSGLYKYNNDYTKDVDSFLGKKIDLDNLKNLYM